MRACYSVITKSIAIDMAVHKVYGIQAVGEEETIYIDDITSSSDRAHALVKLLSDCEVDPIHFRDVIDDFLLMD